MDKCQHYINGDNESFLLDDSNVKETKCVTCRGKITCKNGTNEGTISWCPKIIGSVFSNDNGTISNLIDDHIGNLEDAPLLINDSYREAVDSEFHCHNSLKTSEDASAWKKLSTAAIFCFIFMLAELIGGYLAGSLAVMTDAAHLFSDCIGFLISLLAMWIGKKPPSKTMTFGYYRAEVVGALLSVLTLWLLAAIFSSLAIHRLYHQDYDVDADTMIIIASLGFVVNIIMGGVLFGICHSHSHGISNHYHEPSNINVRAATVHVLGDLLQSLGVLIAALIIKFSPESEIADPICTLIFSVIVVCTTVRVGKDSLWFLIEGSPINTVKLKTELRKLSGVKHIHNLHLWVLSPGKNAAAVHVAVDQYCDRDVLLRKVSTIIQKQISVVSCTIQIEAFNFDLTNSCKQCQIVQC